MNYYEGLYRIRREGIDMVKFKNFIDLFGLELDYTHGGCIFIEHVEEAFEHFKEIAEKRDRSWDTFVKKAEDPTNTFGLVLKNRETDNPYGRRFNLDLYFVNSKKWRWVPTSMEVGCDKSLITFVEYLGDTMTSSNTSEQFREKYRDLYNDYMLLKKEESDVKYLARHLFYLKLYQSLNAISFAYQYDREWGEIYRYIEGNWDTDNYDDEVDSHPIGFGAIDLKSRTAEDGEDLGPLYVFHGIDCLV